MPFYARAGVQHCWLVDPIAQTLEVLRLEGGRWVIVASVGGDETVRVEPFEAIERLAPRLSPTGLRPRSRS